MLYGNALDGNDSHYLPGVCPAKILYSEDITFYLKENYYVRRDKIESPFGG